MTINHTTKTDHWTIFETSRLDQPTRQQGSQENNQPWTSSTEFLTWQGTQQTKPSPSQDIGRLIQNLIHEPSEVTLLEELEDIKRTMSQDTPLSWLTETLMEELWNEEQFQGDDISIHLVPGLQTGWHHLTSHIKQDRRSTGDTIRSWRISLTGENNTNNNRSEWSTCQTRHMTTSNTWWKHKHHGLEMVGTIFVSFLTLVLGLLD